jgi:predicted nucleotidyltransferase component of viral defense system
MINHPLNDLIQKHKLQTQEDYKYTLRRIIQEITLLGLWRAGFFEHSAFYGGTSLSIFHNLDRFSEDLDFSLLTQNEDFSLESYLNSVRNEMISWGIEADVDSVKKTSDRIESAFVKANTLNTFFSLSVPQGICHNLHRNEMIKVKFELDPFPPCSFASEFRVLLDPLPFNVRLMSLPDQFAGKMHALLARGWKERVKGRDWYDLIWFLKQKIHLNIKHLGYRLKQSGHLNKSDKLTLLLLHEILQKRIKTIDFSKAKEDVRPFINDYRQLENWSEGFFLKLVELVVIR